MVGSLINSSGDLDAGGVGKMVKPFPTPPFSYKLYPQTFPRWGRIRVMDNLLSLEQQITFLYTPDLASTSHFYEEIMGLDLALDQGTCRIYHTAPYAYLGVCERADAVIDPGNIIFTLVTPDVDEWYLMLKEKGVQFEKPPDLNPRYQIYHCFLRDPNGYLIEIQRFEDPRWVG